MPKDPLRYTVVGPADGRVVLQLEGALEGEHWSDRLLESLAQHYIDDGVREIVLDLRSLRSIDHSGVDTLRLLRSRANDGSKALTLHGAVGVVRSKLASAGVLEVGEDEETASARRAFAADPKMLQAMRAHLRRLAAEDGFDRKFTDELVLAVSEACANSIVHSGTDRVIVEWRRSGDCVEVLILDSGEFRDRMSTTRPLAEMGRGLLLMMAMVDEVTIREGTPRNPGTSVRLLKCAGS